MVIPWPDFYADHDGTNGFSKFLIFAQNNPLYKFVTFLSNIAVYVHAYGPKFDLNWRFFYNVFFKIEIDCCPIKIPVGKTGNIVIISKIIQAGEPSVAHFPWPFCYHQACIRLKLNIEKELYLQFCYFYDRVQQR